MRKLHSLAASLGLLWGTSFASEAEAQIKSLPTKPETTPDTKAETNTIAGRVMTVDRENKSFTIRPYRNSKGDGQTKITVTDKTTYRWSPPQKDEPLPTLDKVKRGSWVRVIRKGDVVQEVVIHATGLTNSEK